MLTTATLWYWVSKDYVRILVSLCISTHPACSKRGWRCSSEPVGNTITSLTETTTPDSYHASISGLLTQLSIYEQTKEKEQTKVQLKSKVTNIHDVWWRLKLTLQDFRCKCSLSFIEAGTCWLSSQSISSTWASVCLWEIHPIHVKYFPKQKRKANDCWVFSGGGPLGSREQMKNKMIRRQQTEQMEWTFFIYIVLHFPFSYIVFVCTYRCLCRSDEASCDSSVLGGA